MTIDNRGEISFALDMKIERDVKEGILKISQTAYTMSLLKEYNMLDTKPRETPATGVSLSEDDLPVSKQDIETASKIPVRQLIGRLWR